MPKLNCDNPIFVYGCARSGTSLLSRILNSHPNISVPYESHLYNTFAPWLKHYGDLNTEKNRLNLINDMSTVLHDWTPNIDPIAALNATTQYDFDGIIDGVMYSLAQKEGKSRWGDKSPWHVFYWKEIYKAFPNAKIIHIVRDGRDSSASWQKARFGPKHFLVLAERWRDYLLTVDECRAVIAPENFLDIQYEEILKDPELTIKKICSFLGEEYSPEMLEFHKNKTPYPTDKTNLANLTKPLMQDNAQKWKKNLTKDEIRIFEAIAKKQLEQYNYEVSNPQAHISATAKFFIHYVTHPLLRLLSMSKNLKGQSDGFIKLSVYLKRRLSL